jgi:NAD(P)-dependent dehydrogenase (short-subunit alcohol dehydrogenase family)
VLVNNAAVLGNERCTTPEGLESSLVTNLLSPYLLTTALLPRLRASAPARVVNVVSGGMYLAGLGPEVFEPLGTWDGATAYARHKRALMVLTEHWARECAADGVTVNAMHPGWAETPGVARSLPLFLRLTRPVLRTPEEGADTIVWLAASADADSLTGGLWLDREPHPAAVFPGTAGTPAERQGLVDELARLTAGVVGTPDRQRTPRAAPLAGTSRAAGR